MSGSLKMYFAATFVLILSCVNVTMLNVLFDEDVCSEICIADFAMAVSDSKACQRGCRFFFLINSINNQDYDVTLQKCYSSCFEAYNSGNENKSCIYGCDAMHKKNQLGPIHEMFQDFLKISNGSICSSFKNSDSKMSSGASHHLISEDDSFNEEYGCNSLQCSNIIQLSFFCITLSAIIVCTIKVMVLMYQFKLSTLKYVVEASLNDSSNKIRVRKNVPQDRQVAVGA